MQVAIELPEDVGEELRANLACVSLRMLSAASEEVYGVG